MQAISEVNDNLILLMSGEAWWSVVKLIYFSESCWINRIVVIELLRIWGKCTKSHYTAQKQRFGVLLEKLPPLVLIVWWNFCYWKLRAFHRNNIKFFRASLTTQCMLIWDVISTGWDDDPNSQSINEHSLPCLRWSLHFQVLCAPSQWPSDLSMCDYFLCGKIKAHVHKHKSPTLDNSKKAVHVVVTQIDTPTLETRVANLQECHQKSINRRGQQMIDTVFHTWFNKCQFDKSTWMSIKSVRS